MFEVKGKSTDEIVQVYATERKQYEFGERTEFLIYDSEGSEFVWVNSAEYEPFNPFEINIKMPEVDEETLEQLRDKLSCALATEFTVPRTAHYPSHSHSIGSLSTPIERESMYEITERLSNDELKEGLYTLQEEYGYKVYRHRNGTEYVVDSGAIVNVGGKSYWGLHYREFTGMATEDDTPIHTRPLFEFLDGRFELGKGENA